MDIEEGGITDDHVEFNNLSDLDVFTRQYIGTTLQGRGDSISVIDEEENNSTNASTEIFESQSEKDSITDLESLRDDQASDDTFNAYDCHLIIYRNQYMQYQENLYETYGIKCLKASSFENMKAHSCENVTDPVTFFQKMSYRGYILFRISVLSPISAKA